jgi:hypothetical protein
VLHRLLEVFADIVLTAVFADIPGSSTVKAFVVLFYVSIDRDNDHVVVSDELCNLGNGILAIVIVLQRVAVTMPMKVVNDRIPGLAGIIAGR